MDRVEAALERLEEAQQRTDEAVRGLGIAVGELQRSFGATIEEEAADTIQWILEGKGYRLLAEAVSLSLDGEVDVVMPMAGPSGERVWVVAEAKARLAQRQVREWGQRMQSGGWQKRLVDAGVPGPYLFYVYGIRVDLKAGDEAEAQGIGLATGRGERVPPAGLVAPPHN